MPWYAGNLHCHSTNSDGDSSPKDVANWYYKNGYSFVSITDHNTLTHVEEYTLDNKDFIGITGSEYTRSCDGVQTHLNGFGINEPLLLPKETDSVVESIQFGVDEINKAGGLAMINHPNWLWSFGANEISQIEGATFFEVYNAGITCNNEGDEEHDSTDEIWDEVLSAGKPILGIASDDAHHYNSPPISPNGPKDASGTGWVWVQAEELTQQAILENLKKGNFIATTGVKLKTLSREATEIKFEIEPMGEIKFTTTFIGKNGEILDKQMGNSVAYQIKGNEGYVRARIESTDCIKAWVQPIFL